MAEKQYYVKIDFEYGVDNGDGTFDVKNDGRAAWYSMGYANATSHAQAMNTVQLATVAKMVDLIANTSPSEGGSDSAALGMLAKMMGNVPPVTP